MASLLLAACSWLNSHRKMEVICCTVNYSNCTCFYPIELLRQENNKNIQRLYITVLSFTSDDRHDDCLTAVGWDSTEQSANYILESFSQQICKQ